MEPKHSEGELELILELNAKPHLESQSMRKVSSHFKKRDSHHFLGFLLAFFGIIYEKR